MGRLVEHRTVASFAEEGFTLMVQPGLPDEQVWWKNISYDEKTGQGSYLMIMAPGTRCNPHEHTGPEEFYMVEGDLVDCDGVRYEAGEFVSLTGGSRHYSVSPSGCRIVVTHRGPVVDLEYEDLPENVL
jgi:quercetin dioxygenase-like cupin family protein